MSTAFMVENILSDEKEEPVDSSSDSESDSHNSDMKDSLCDSPKSYNSINNHHNSSLSDDDILRSYTMIQDNHADPISELSEFSEFSCQKCGHFNVKNSNESNQSGSDAKCEKCGYLHEFKETLLKEVVKPILKFSVSAILSDTKRECVKVRNGKFLEKYCIQNL